MAIEIVNRIERSTASDKETLCIVGGAVLMVVGAGLLLSSPRVRRFLDDAGWANLASKAVPDLQRYFKLRSM